MEYSLKQDTILTTEVRGLLCHKLDSHGNRKDI